MFFEDFIKCCFEEKCLRGCFITNNCQKISKQKKCYKKFLEQQKKSFEKQKENFIFQQEKLIKKQKESLLLKKEKGFKEDENYKKFRIAVWKDDCGFHDFVYKRKDWKKYCKIWNILTKEEREHVENTYKEDMIILADYLDVCHIVAKGGCPSLKYDEKNGVVCSRYFHRLLDSFFHPVTKKRITAQERRDWFLGAKNRQLDNYKGEGGSE